MLIISGCSGSGKSTVAKAIIDRHILNVDNIVNVGDIVLKITKSKKGIKLKHNSMVLEELDKVVNKNTVLVGARENYIIDYFVAKYNAKVIILIVSERERINRLLERGLTLQQIKDKFIDEIQIGMFDVIYHSKEGRNKYIFTEQDIECTISDILSMSSKC